MSWRSSLVRPSFLGLVGVVALISSGCTSARPQVDSPGTVSVVMASPDPLQPGIYQPTRWSSGKLTLRLGEDLPAGRFDLELKRRNTAKPRGTSRAMPRSNRSRRSTLDVAPPNSLTLALEGTGCEIRRCGYKIGPALGPPTCEVYCPD